MNKNLKNLYALKKLAFRSLFSTFVCVSLFGCKLEVTSIGEGIVKSESTSIECGQTFDKCSATYQSTRSELLVALPAEGWLFSGWSGECHQIIDKNTCQVDIPYGSVLKVNALFEPDENPFGVVIPDPLLRQCIWNRIEQQQAKSIAEVTKLYCHAPWNGPRITNLEGLEAFYALTSLELWQQAIRDIAPISHLNQLTTVKLQSTEKINLDDISSMNSITSLFVSSDQLDSLEAIAGWTQLRSLAVFSQTLSDIDIVSNLTSLEDLNLSGFVTSVDALSNLTQLKSLLLNFNTITDVTPLYNLTQLEILELEQNPDIPCTQINQLKELINGWVAYDGCYE